VTVSRTLPAEIAPRFANASRAGIRSEKASLEVVVAERFALRLRGLALLDESSLVPLLFPRCRSLHTFGMRTSIDIVWLDRAAERAARVLAVAEAVAPRRFVRAPRGAPRRRTAALELGAGDAAALGLGPGTSVTLRFDTGGWSPNAATR
jgi:uncharacterized membrane protein (UPF0127 family)